MNRQLFVSLHRAAAVICALVLMAIALPASASDQPLPLPEPASQTRDIIIIIVPLTPEPISPVSQQEFNVNGSFQWANVGALKYTLKFKNLRTGEIIRQATPGICSQYCWMSEASAGLRTTYRDGDVFTWQVIAKMENGTKVNSSKAKAIFNEVDKANLMSPAKDSAINWAGGFAFSWTDSPLAKEFTLIVRNAETGTVAIKASGERLDWCSANCTYAPAFDQLAALQFGQDYEWQVKTVGMTGEKAKSAVSTFKWLVVLND